MSLHLPPKSAYARVHKSFLHLRFQNLGFTAGIKPSEFVKAFKLWVVPLQLDVKPVHFVSLNLSKIITLRRRGSYERLWLNGAPLQFRNQDAAQDQQSTACASNTEPFTQNDV